MLSQLLTAVLLLLPLVLRCAKRDTWMSKRAREDLYDTDLVRTGMRLIRRRIETVYIRRLYVRIICAVHTYVHQKHLWSTSRYPSFIQVWRPQTTHDTGTYIKCTHHLCARTCRIYNAIRNTSQNTFDSLEHHLSYIWYTYNMRIWIPCCCCHNIKNRRHNPRSTQSVRSVPGRVPVAFSRNAVPHKWTTQKYNAVFSALLDCWIAWLRRGTGLKQ